MLDHCKHELNQPWLMLITMANTNISAVIILNSPTGFTCISVCMFVIKCLRFHKVLFQLGMII